MICHAVWPGMIVAGVLFTTTPAIATDTGRPSEAQEERSLGSGHEKSPGVAFALSLTPAPIDFGNLYSANSDWALVYTGAEVALAGSIVWFGAEKLCWREDFACTFSTGDAWAMGALVTAYVGVKMWAGLHAASAARAYNRERGPSFAVLPAPDGARAMLRTSF